MTKKAGNSPTSDKTPWGVGDLVLVHGIHLAIVVLYYEPSGLWLVRLMDGTELGLWYDDLEPLTKQE